MYLSKVQGLHLNDDQLNIMIIIPLPQIKLFTF